MASDPQVLVQSSLRLTAEREQAMVAYCIDSLAAIKRERGHLAPGQYLRGSWMWKRAIATARYNVVSLREGLVTLLRVAGERELSGKPVPEKTATDIRVRHAQLLYHTALQASFERQRAELDVEIEQIMQRYRDLKASDAPGARVALDLPPAPKQ